MYFPRETLVINKCVLIFPVCLCGCSDLSELCGDVDRMQDWQKAMWVLHGQQGLIACVSFMEEPRNDLRFLWPFLCNVRAVRGSSRVPVHIAVHSSLVHRPTESSGSGFQKPELLQEQVLLPDNSGILTIVKSLILQTSPLLFSSHTSK